jgi:hypothetical protein
MSEPEGITPYRLEYAGRVHDEFAGLIARAKVHNRHRPLLAAARKMDYRLRVYPQFGQPLRDLAAGAGQEWLGVVPPLVVRYVIFEDRRLVSVVFPMQLLRGYHLG